LHWGDTFGPMWGPESDEVPSKAVLSEGFVAKAGTLAELRMPDDGGKSMRRLRRARDRAMKTEVDEAGAPGASADAVGPEDGGKHKSIDELVAAV